jgi:carbamoyltransferase
VSRSIYVLGVPNFANYEASTALLRIPADGGEIDYVCIGEDRLTRQKHTYLFPLRGIDYCLRHFGLESLAQVDWIATDYARVPRWHDSGPAYRKLEHDYLKLMLDFPRERILVVDHHDGHAASCYYPSGFDEAGVLVVDGMGSELNTQTAYHFRGDEVTWCERGYDWGIGRLYSLVTGAVLPYGPEKGYGKVMGLAPYGAGAPPLDLDLRGRNRGMQSDYSHLFTRYPISRLVADAPKCPDRERVMEPEFARAAFEVQQECERQLVAMAREIHARTGTRRLCISGGVALNGRANYRILKDTPIEELWIQPACSDTGNPFGVALWAWFQLLRQRMGAARCSVAMRHAYCGSPYPAQEIDSVLERYGIESAPTDPRDVARRLAGGEIVAVFEGGSEFGPRALGHRSILADPRSPQMCNHLNRSVKFREAYRPYAPVVLRERVSDWFDIDCESPFMLLVADVNEDVRSVIPSVTHVDGTARVQTVTREDNGAFYEIVREFGEITGVPVILNTSFNVNREPIVETPLDALICSLGTSIHWLALEGRLVDCSRHRDPELVKRMRADREAALDAQYARLTRRYLHRYDRDEMEGWLREENAIADWHRCYRAKYELEKAMLDWRRRGASVLLVGTRRHTLALYLYVADFPLVEVAAFVPADDLPGESGDFHGVYPEWRLENVDWSAVGAVLISSHEYQRELARRVRAACPPELPILELYDDACDSLCFVLPERWPVMNPGAAKLHGLALRAESQRTASNIDFDVEPARIEVGERYAVAINYHFLRDESPGRFRLRAHERPRRFAEQLARLAENFSFCRIRDLVDPAARLPESSIAITFDDGARDVIEHAAPILERQGATATVYVCSRPYVDGRLLDVHRIEYLMHELGVEGFREAFAAELKNQFPSGVEREPLDFAGDYRFYRYDEEAVREFKLDLNYRLPYGAVGPVLDALFAAVFGAGAEAEAVRATYLGLDDLKRLRDRGFELGVHTRHHRVLPRLDYEAQLEEIRSGMEFLRGVTGDERFTVAYPYGFHDLRTRRAMKQLGALAGVSMDRRMIKPDDIQARWSLPRYDVNDCFDRRSNEIAYAIFASLSTGD